MCADQVKPHICNYKIDEDYPVINQALKQGISSINTHFENL